MDSNTKTNSGKHGTPWYQKALLFALLLSLASFDESLAAKLTLSWDPSPDTSVAGYKVYYGPAGSATRQSVNVGNSTRAALTNLTEGVTYDFYVTAYSGVGAESDPSNEITYTIPGLPDPYAPAKYTLGVGSFRDGFVNVSPKGTGIYRDEYLAGTPVTLTATAVEGAKFMGWYVNNVLYTTPQVKFVISADTVATPYFRNTDGKVSFGPGASGLSMSIERTAGGSQINVGGEAGAWVLDISYDLVNWQQFTAGITSERIALNSSVGNAYFRVRGR